MIFRRYKQIAAEDEKPAADKATPQETETARAKNDRDQRERSKLDRVSNRASDRASNRILSQRWQRYLVWGGLLAFVWLACSAQVAAETLTERQQAFPNWQSKPAVQLSDGDLVYPDWINGTWRMTSTLVDMQAPLAPEIVTPGFEGNRQFLDKPVKAIVKFKPVKVSRRRFLDKVIPGDDDEVQIVSDRAFNGLSLARASLGDDWVKAVKIDPDDPNRQITFLKDNQQLISTVSGRIVEQPNPATFATTEIFQQYFRNAKDANSQPVTYLNEVENTTIYRRHSDPNFPISADQITAIYLSPQDPNYFKAQDRPVALYRYQLSFSPV